MVMYVLSVVFPTEIFLCLVPALIVPSDRPCSDVAVPMGMARKVGLAQGIIPGTHMVVSCRLSMSH